MRRIGHSNEFGPLRLKTLGELGIPQDINLRAGADSWPIEGGSCIKLGVICGEGVYEAGAVKGMPAMREAYEMGKRVSSV